MTLKETAWAMLMACCRQQEVVCERCSKLGIGTGTLAFFGAVESLLEKSNLPWRLEDMEELLDGIVRNNSATIEKFPEEMRQDVALFLFYRRFTTGNPSVKSLMRTFSSLAVDAGVDETSLENLIIYIWRTYVQKQLDEERTERQREDEGLRIPRGFLRVRIVLL